jgi:hypothetical protein
VPVEQQQRDHRRRHRIDTAPIGLFAQFGIGPQDRVADRDIERRRVRRHRQRRQPVDDQPAGHVAAAVPADPVGDGEQSDVGA